MMVAKCQDHVQLIFLSGINEVLFFQERDGPFFPTLKLLHKYPTIMTRVVVDTGAIKLGIYLLSFILPATLSSNSKILPFSSTKITTYFGARKRYVLQGANVMVPGLTSPTGFIPDGLEAGVPVAIYATNKEHALGLGLTKMSGLQM